MSKNYFNQAKSERAKKQDKPEEFEQDQQEQEDNEDFPALGQIGLQKAPSHIKDEANELEDQWDKYEDNSQPVQVQQQVTSSKPLTFADKIKMNIQTQIIEQKDFVSLQDAIKMDPKDIPKPKKEAPFQDLKKDEQQLLQEQKQRGLEKSSSDPLPQANKFTQAKNIFKAAATDEQPIQKQFKEIQIDKQTEMLLKAEEELKKKRQIEEDNKEKATVEKPAFRVEIQRKVEVEAKPEQPSPKKEEEQVVQVKKFVNTNKLNEPIAIEKSAQQLKEEEIERKMQEQLDLEKKQKQQEEGEKQQRKKKFGETLGQQPNPVESEVLKKWNELAHQADQNSDPNVKLFTNSNNPKGNKSVEQPAAKKTAKTSNPDRQVGKGGDQQSDEKNQKKKPAIKKSTIQQAAGSNKGTSNITLNQEWD